MAGDRQWVAGGELGSPDKSAQDLKQIILNILQEEETVTKALKRLKPVSKKATGKRKTRSTAKQADAAANDEDAEEKANLFSQLTEAAGELMNLGFEDIYQDTKSKIADTLSETAEENANRGGVVWHDDGTVKDDAAKEHTMYQRDKADSALTFQESAKIGNTSEASLADTAPPQIPVPATSTIPDADQSSLAAVQQAATTAADPVTELADSSVAPSTSTVQTTDTDRMSSQPQATASNGIAHNAKPSEAADGAAAETDASMHSQPASSLPEDEAMTTEQQAAGTEAPQLSEHNEGIAEHASAPANTTTDACDLDGQQHDAAAQADTAAVDDSAGPRAMDTAARTAEQQPSDTGPASTDDTAATSVSAAPAAATSIEEAAADTATDADAAATETTATTAAPTDTAAAAPAATAGGGGGNSWRGTGKGPGLGQSQEFSGGPMNFARPKYRHAPYNLPPPRGGERFGPGPGSTWSPRGRGSPRGGMAPAPGRGFNDPLRSSIMRPQYRQQPPPSHGRPDYGQPPPYAYPPQGPPPAYYPPPQQQFQQQYPPHYPPPQQPYAAQYAQAPYTPPPPYGGAPTYAAPPPAQPPPYDPQWQNQSQGQYASYQQTAAYPGAPPA